MLWLLYLTAFLDIFSIGLLIPVTPDILSYLGLSSEWSGYALSIYALMSFLSGFLIGRFSDRYGRKKALLITSVCALFANIMLAIALHPGWIAIGILGYILSRMIAGVGASGIAVVQASVADIVPSHERAKYMGYLGAMFGMAFLVGPLIGGVMAKIGGVSMIAYTMIAASVIQISLLVFCFRETTHTRLSGESLHPTSRWTIASVFAHRELRAFLLISFVTTAAFSSLSGLSPVYYSDILQIDSLHISYLLAAVGITSIMFQVILFPRLRDRFSEFGYFCIAFSGLSASFLFFSTIDSYPQALLTSFLFPLFFSGITPLISAGLSRRSAGEIGTILGINSSVAGAAQFIGPLILAWLYAHHVRLPFALAGVLFLLLAIFSFIQYRYQKTA